MPTVVHAIFGGILGLFAYLVSRNSPRVFNERMVIVFALNAFIGPDLIKIPRIFIAPADPVLLALDQYLHSVFGWITWSFGIALLFWQLANVRARYPESITYFNSVKLVMGAGFTHLGLDILDLSQEGYGSLSVFPWDPSTAINLDTFHTGWYFTDGILDIGSRRLGAALLLGTGLLFLIMLVYFLVKKKDVKRSIIGASIFVAIIIAMIALFGSEIVYDEHDLGYFVYMSLFLFVPLALIYWAMQDTRITIDARRILSSQLLERFKGRNNKEKAAREQGS